MQRAFASHEWSRREHSSISIQEPCEFTKPCMQSHSAYDFVFMDEFHAWLCVFNTRLKLSVHPDIRSANLVCVTLSTNTFRFEPICITCCSDLELYQVPRYGHTLALCYNFCNVPQGLASYWVYICQITPKNSISMKNLDYVCAANMRSYTMPWCQWHLSIGRNIYRHSCSHVSSASHLTIGMSNSQSSSISDD